MPDGYYVDPLVVAQQAQQRAAALAQYRAITLPYAQFQLARAQQDAARSRLQFDEDRTRKRDGYFSPYLGAGLNNSGIANRAAQRFTFDTVQGQQDIDLRLADERQRLLYELLRNRAGIGLDAAGATTDLYGQSTGNYGNIYGK